MVTVAGLLSSLQLHSSGGTALKSSLCIPTQRGQNLEKYQVCAYEVSQLVTGCLKPDSLGGIQKFSLCYLSQRRNHRWRHFSFFKEVQSVLSSCNRYSLPYTGLTWRYLEI